jgi:hypothetical protein
MHHHEVFNFHGKDVKLLPRRGRYVESCTATGMQNFNVLPSTVDVVNTRSEQRSNKRFDFCCAQGFGRLGFF